VCCVPACRWPSAALRPAELAEALPDCGVRTLEMLPDRLTRPPDVVRRRGAASPQSPRVASAACRSVVRIDGSTRCVRASRCRARTDADQVC
jgi:hypothetical protein